MVYIDNYINLANNIEIKKHFLWSKSTYRIDRIVQEPDNHTLYYLQDGPDTAFAPEELIHIPEDTQIPSEWVSKWK